MEHGGQSSEGAAVAGCRRVVDPPPSPFLFDFLCFRSGVCVLLPQHLVSCLSLGVVLSGPAAVSPVCFIYKAGQKPISRLFGPS